MIYKINNNIVHSENAAKSYLQASSYVLKLIYNIKRVNSILDFGCGKLRYSFALRSRCDKLTIVDSRIQLERNQKIHGSYTNVYSFISNYKNIEAIPFCYFTGYSIIYDYIFCANVLSAIPCVATRGNVLQHIYKLMSPTSISMFITQYTNSYFKRVANSGRAKKHLDGWLLDCGKRGYSYYGIINRDKLRMLLVNNGYTIVCSWVYNQSAYALATK